MAVYRGPLGQLPPSDTRHRELYPLVATTIPSGATPIVLGTDWHENFDEPVEKRHGHYSEYFIGIDPAKLGAVRGGHCICGPAETLHDPTSWWDFYDQGREGACVGYAVSRALSLMNRQRYDALELYHAAQAIDEWPGEDYEGTSTRAGLDVVHDRGPRVIKGGTSLAPEPANGIAAFRWATDIASMYMALKSPTLQARGLVALLNSWGREYPHKVLMPAETLDVIVFQQGRGEIAVITDR